MGFEVGDAFVLEAQVGSGGLEALFEGAVVGGELADSLLEGGVLGGDAPDGLLGPFGLQVADLAEEFADAGALGGDLGVGGLEPVLGVQRSFAPGRLTFVVLVGKQLGPVFTGLSTSYGSPGDRTSSTPKRTPCQPQSLTIHWHRHYCYALRLNCLTNAYAPLWTELYDPAWRNEEWATDWLGLKALGDATAIRPEWTYATPLRTERERRAALVELDALVALWLGISAEELAAVYRSRYAILADRDAETWFDANGRKIAGNYNTHGYGQTKEHFEQLMEHLDPEINGPVPEGYTGPFYKADREGEYRQAHAVFAERLRQAEAAGWKPDGRRG